MRSLYQTEELRIRKTKKKKQKKETKGRQNIYPHFFNETKELLLFLERYSCIYIPMLMPTPMPMPTYFAGKRLNGMVRNETRLASES